MHGKKLMGFVIIINTMDIDYYLPNIFMVHKKLMTDIANASQTSVNY